MTNSVAPEPEGSSPHSQQPANGPYPEPAESTPHPPTNLSKVHFDPIYALVLLMRYVIKLLHGYCCMIHREAKLRVAYKS
jgi:hypothetical protein